MLFAFMITVLGCLWIRDSTWKFFPHFIERLILSYCYLQTAIEKYCVEHPEYQPRPVKSFLSKAEQRIKDRYDGKPEKPPV